MRRRIWKHAIDCNVVETMLAQTDRGARLMIQPIPALSAIRPTKYLLKVADARALAAALLELAQASDDVSPKR
jgi:hypothetical protein